VRRLDAAADPEQVADLFAAALEIPPEERARFLAGACAGRERLRAEVESLLEAHRRSPAFLEAERAAVLGGAGAGSAAQPGQRIGAYRLLGELGRGGMGTVYLAERADGAFEQRVALKLIHRGLAAAGMLDRFLRERQILARLEHPNIARLLDGGIAEDGSPYFAMEVVRGTPLTTYCDERRLPIDGRLALFDQACGAVLHAHAHLVVHRDIKPSNMLVTEDGGLKLLDFGIAKLLGDDGDEAAALTRGGPQPLTPEYAAPEQLRGEPATTATDVYSLGVVLYELLAGRRPFAHSRLDARGEAPDPEPPSSAVSRALPHVPGSRQKGERSPQEVAAARATTPQRLRRSLAGDLEAIVLQALQHDPERRYPSVEALAEDVRRFRAGQPVRARPATLGYRAGKLLRRHRVAAVAATAAVVSLLVGLAASLWQARVAARERDRASAAAAEAGEVADYLVAIFRDADPEQGAGSAVTARELLDRGAARLDATLRDRPLTRARLQEAIAGAYHSLRQLDRERDLLRAAVAVREREQGAAHADLIAPLLALAGNHFRATRYREAQAAVERATAIAERHHLQTTARFAPALFLRGNLQLVQGSWAAAEATYRRALALPSAPAATAGVDRSAVLNSLGVALYSQRRHEEAVAVHRQALAIRERTRGGGHWSVAQSLFNLAQIDVARGRPQAAAPSAQRALAIRHATYGPDHPAVAEVRALQAEIAVAQGTPAAAEAEWREALRIRETVLGARHPETAATRLRLALLLGDLGRVDEAAPLAEAALATLQAVEGADPADVVRARAAVTALRARMAPP
jgi:eukaryotic-like serine/threonine-protein kinase